MIEALPTPKQHGLELSEPSLARLDRTVRKLRLNWFSGIDRDPVWCLIRTRKFKVDAS